MDKNLKIDLSGVICKTFYEFAIKEPKQFNEPDKGWEYWATYFRFNRASSMAVDNLLEGYEIKRKE
jgi:hypothetical protein